MVATDLVSTAYSAEETHTRRMETIDLHALSPLQERRLMTYVEEKSLDITREFQKRCGRLVVQSYD